MAINRKKISIQNFTFQLGWFCLINGKPLDIFIEHSRERKTLLLYYTDTISRKGSDWNNWASPRRVAEIYARTLAQRITRPIATTQDNLKQTKYSGYERLHKNWEYG